MKAAKQRREPESEPREPFASDHTQEEMLALDGAAQLAEIERATRKSQSAQDQIARGDVLPYLNPEDRDHSAMATVGSLVPEIEWKVAATEKLRDGQRRSGRRRAKDSKDAAAPKYAKIRKLADGLLQDNSPREVVRLIGEHGYPATTVRRALRDHKTGHWSPKRRKSATR